MDGFTLIEILVALAVLAIALAAMVSGVASHAANATYMRDRTLAHWVAMNKIAEVQIGRDWPATGESEGEALMADRDWHWTLTVSDTFDASVRRIEVAVRVSEEAPAPSATLTAFIGRTRP